MATRAIRLLTSERIAKPMKDQLLHEVSGLEIHETAGDVELAEELVDAEVFFGLIRAESIPRAPALQWVQYSFAGIPSAVCREVLARNIRLTNASGIYDRTIAEHVVGMMIALARRFDLCFRLQQAREWAQPVAPKIEDLAGQTAAIVGLGSLGQSIAMRLKALGMRVIGCRREPQPTPFVDQLFSSDQLVEMASQSRWLVLAAPLTPETKGMVSREVLSALPKGSRVVNIGRGATMDHGALIDLLYSGHLAGAGLDVVPSEPLAPDDPLWSAPNLMLTAHCSCNPADDSPAAAEILLRNLHRYQAGEPLENVVDPSRGY